MPTKTDNRYTIYLQSYRKYKFWFNFFYLYLFFVLLFLPLNVKELNLIANYQKVKDFGQNLSLIDSLIRKLNLNSKKITELEQTTLLEFDDKLLENVNEYEESILRNDSLVGIWKSGRRFDPQNKETKKYFQKRRKFLINYNKREYGNVHESIKNYLREDTLAITTIQINFDSLRKKEFALKPTISQKAVNDSVAQLMFKQIQSTIDSLGNIYLYPVIFHISPIKIQYPKSDSMWTFKKYKTISLINSSNIDSLEKKHSGEIPYVGAKLQFKKYLSVIYFIALSCLFILPFYFINYKYREDSIDILERVNSFGNIFIIMLNKKFFLLLKRWSPLITTFIIPVVSFVCITYLVSGIWQNAIWFSGVIIIIYIFFCFFGKNKIWLMKN